MKIVIDGEKYISMKDVLEYLGWKEHKLYTESKEGRIPKALKLDERSFWKESEIEEYKKRIESTRKEPKE
jgi:predicted DNA-binding transcriptional regulator AlpA